MVGVCIISNQTTLSLSLPLSLVRSLYLSLLLCALCVRLPPPSLWSDSIFSGGGEDASPVPSKRCRWEERDSVLEVEGGASEVRDVWEPDTGVESAVSVFPSNPDRMFAWNLSTLPPCARSNNHSPPSPFFDSWKGAVSHFPTLL